MRLAPPPNLLDPVRMPSDTARSLARPIARRALRMLRTIVVVCAVVFAVLAWTTRSSSPNVIRALRDSGAVRSVLAFLRTPSGALMGERDGRITVLLLGMGGEGHEGPLLTDTILVATIEPAMHRVVLTSVPRDLAVPLPDGRVEKANAINAYAEVADPGHGGDATRAALERTLDLDIPYHIRVDFSGFSGLIDDLGGVDVDVDRTLDDPEYPIVGKEDAPWPERFERLVIPAGRVHMDGALALKYVRSRHARNGEGSDFARSRRQQRLLLAVRDRATAHAIAMSPRRILALLDAWRSHVETNLAPPQLLRLANIAERVAASAVVDRIVFTDDPGGELIAGFVSGSYVLHPRDGTFDRIRTIIADAIAGRVVPNAAPVAEAAPVAPAAAITAEIWNGTPITGFAARTADLLAREGVTVRMVRNAPARTVSRTVIYYHSRVPDALVTRLRDLLHADTSTVFPNFASIAPNAAPTAPPDLLIVLGTSSLAAQLPHSS